MLFPFPLNFSSVPHSSTFRQSSLKRYLDILHFHNMTTILLIFRSCLIILLWEWLCCCVTGWEKHNVFMSQLTTVVEKSECSLFLTSHKTSRGEGEIHKPWCKRNPTALFLNQLYLNTHTVTPRCGPSWFPVTKTESLFLIKEVFARNN